MRHCKKQEDIIKVLKALLRRRFGDAVGTLRITTFLCCEISRITTIYTKRLFVYRVIEFLQWIIAMQISNAYLSQAATEVKIC